MAFWGQIKTGQKIDADELDWLSYLAESSKSYCTLLVLIIFIHFTQSKQDITLSKVNENPEDWQCVLWYFNFLHIFAISSSNKNKKGCQMLKKLFVIFRHSRKTPCTVRQLEFN